MSDGCEHCGDRSICPEDETHRQACADLYAARRAAAEAADFYGIPAVAVDDLWAHLVSPRPSGAWCTPDAAAFVVRCAAELGWRPVVGAALGRDGTA